MRQIILASGSPRRKDLLTQMKVPFTVVASEYDERLDDTRSVSDVACELGLGKALAVAELHPEALVIGSDTIVSFKDRQLGKQPDAKTAKELLLSMSGQAIAVTTSIALVCKAAGLKEVETEVSQIVFAAYDEAALDTYIASGDWVDKAGAVAIQSSTSPTVDHIEGRYDTILGLATAPLARLLQLQGVDATVVELQAPWPQANLSST